MLCELTVANFRNLKHIQLSPGPRVNIVSGGNGAGKSSLIEAMDFLSRGRTFRTRLSRPLIRDGNDELTVSAALDAGRHLGIRRQVNAGEAKTSLRIDGENASSQAEMAAALPFIVFHAGHLKLVRSESQHWRNMLDWGVFHVKPLFRDAWRLYRRALRQRNLLLRESHGNRQGKGGDGTLASWNRQMAEQAEILDSCRRDYAEALIATTEAMASAQNAPLGVRYSRGWPTEKGDFLRLLEESDPGDRRVGYTRYGPHRAALRLLWDGEPASERASRGQQKSAAAMLMLAQIRLFVEASGRSCVVAVDDLAAEFDERHRHWLLGELESTGQQVFVTVIDPFPLGGAPEARVFHMKHGEISPVSAE